MSLTVDISKKYKSFHLDVHFDSEEKATGILGASGCGKSLTLKCLAGIVTPDQGRIEHNGRVLFDSEKKINLPPRERNIGFVFQNYALFPNMTVKENIKIAIREKGNKNKKIEELLQLFRISNLQNRYPGQLSGGEQQRVALARIMAYRPDLLMFDEPFSALDTYLKHQLQQELSDYLCAYSGDILMVSHSREELYYFCERIAIMNHGRMLRIDSKSEVFENPGELTAAKLTGCKNISRARKGSDNKVYAIDWDIELNVDKQVEDDIRYIGIRAHNLRPSSGMDQPNTMKVEIAGFDEGPFEHQVNFYNDKPERKGSILHWIVSKQDWSRLYKEKYPEYISFPTEHIHLLKNNS